MPTGWILRESKLADLKNHPVDAEIYGEPTVDDELLSSIKSNGILDPLVATKDGVILSGHRRKNHGMKAGLKTANVLWARHAMSDDEQVVNIVESNRYREKSTEQKAREFGRLSEALAAMARKRQAHGKTAPGKTLGGNSPQANAGRAKDQAAEQVGMDRSTAEKALEVAKNIDQAVAAGDKKRAEELRTKLNEKSVSAAHRQATGKNGREPGEDKTEPEHRKPKAFDEKEIDNAFGQLVRLLDKRGDAFHCKNGAHHKACLKHLDEFMKSMKDWRRAC